MYIVLSLTYVVRMYLSHVDNCTGIVETWVDENVNATS